MIIMLTKSRSILFALIIQLLLIHLRVVALDFIYVRGDWVIYRYVMYGSILDVEVWCEFVILITIEDVEDHKVTYYASWSIVRIDKGFDICIRIPESDRYTVNVSLLAPARGEFIVDPTHSGIYNVIYKGFTGKAEYYKGVLVSLDASFYNLTTKIDLINSSISELKQYAKLNYTYTIPTYAPTTIISITNTSYNTSVGYGGGYATMLYVVVAVLLISIMLVIILARVRIEGRKRRYIRALKNVARAYV